MKSIGQILGSESYQQQIGSEQWRNFASGIKRRRDFCECCQRSDVALQVHHLFYDFDKKLWEYDESDVIVLCSGCHKEIHDQLKSFRKHVFRYLNGQSFKILNGAMAVALTQYDPLVFVHALAEFVSNPRLVENHARAWNMTAKNKEKFEPKLDRKWMEDKLAGRLPEQQSAQHT